MAFFNLFSIVDTLRKSLQTMSTSPCRTQVLYVATFLVCFLIFIEYEKDWSKPSSLWYNRFMDKKYEKISQDLGVTLKQIDTVLSLTAEGATIPFIARYRKDMTGSLDEVAIKAIIDLDKSLTNLNDRKEAVLAKIQEQGKLTKELEEAILAAEN